MILSESTTQEKFVTEVSDWPPMHELEGEGDRELPTPPTIPFCGLTFVSGPPIR